VGGFTVLNRAHCFSFCGSKDLCEGAELFQEIDKRTGLRKRKNVANLKVTTCLSLSLSLSLKSRMPTLYGLAPDETRARVKRFFLLEERGPVESKIILKWKILF
jgi:hypothetical protein